LLKFPTQPNRELFTRNREFNLLIREFLSENREAIRVDILPDDETYKRGTLGYNDPAGCSRDRGVFAIIWSGLASHGRTDMPSGSSDIWREYLWEALRAMGESCETLAQNHPW